MSLYLPVVSKIGSHHLNASPVAEADPLRGCPADSAFAAVSAGAARALSWIVSQTPPAKKPKQINAKPNVGTRPKRPGTRLRVAGRRPGVVDPIRLVIPNSSLLKKHSTARIWRWQKLRPRVVAQGTVPETQKFTPDLA